jgi:hypothetical protein
MADTMTETIRIPGTYEIYRQRQGAVGIDYLVTLYSFRNVHNVLRMWADQERCGGLRIEPTDGGFISYMKKGKTLITFNHYWYEEIIPDEKVQIDRWIDDALFVARATAADEVRRAEMDAQADYRRSAE